MQLTEFQKKIIRRILDGKVFDILSFMVEYFDIPNVNSRADFETIIYNIRTKAIQEKIKVKNIDTAGKYVVEFFILISFLEKNNLVFVKHSENFILFHFVTDYVDAKSKDDIRELNSLLYKYPRDEFYPSPELEDFVKNNYILKDDVYRNALLKDNKKYFSLIFLISILLIILAAAAVIFSVFSSRGNKEEINQRVDTVIIEKQIQIDNNEQDSILPENK